MDFHAPLLRVTWATCSSKKNGPMIPRSEMAAQTVHLAEYLGNLSELLTSPEHIALLIDLLLEVEVDLISGPKQTPKNGVFLHLLQHFVTHDLPLCLVGCRKVSAWSVYSRNTS